MTGGQLEGGLPGDSACLAGAQHRPVDLAARAPPPSCRSRSANLESLPEGWLPPERWGTARPATSDGRSAGFGRSSGRRVTVPPLPRPGRSRHVWDARQQTRIETARLSVISSNSSAAAGGGIAKSRSAPRRPGNRRAARRVVHSAPAPGPPKRYLPCKGRRPALRSERLVDAPRQSDGSMPPARSGVTPSSLPRGTRLVRELGRRRAR